MVLWLKKLAPAAVVVAVALWSVWPVVVKPGRIADYGYDGWFINWIINRQIKIISDCIRDLGDCKSLLFQGNIYYPYKNTLAYSDMHSLDAIVAFVPVVLSKNPAFASGWVMAVGQMATVLVVYLWWKEIAGNRWAAAVGSIALGLSQIRWEYQVHLHTWGMQWWLLGTWLIIKWLKGEKWVKGVAGAVLLGAQMWESVLPVYFAITVLATYLIFNFQFLMLRKILLIFFVSGLVAWPVVGVYSDVSNDMGFVRTIRDAANGGISLNDPFGKFYSPGLYILLIVSGLKLLKSQIPNPKSQTNFKFQNSNTKFFLLVLLIGLVMAMGPTLKWQGKTVKIGGKYPVPLPYAAAYYTVPGLQALRTTSRWMWLAAFGASGLIAIGLSDTSPKRLGFAWAIFVAIVGGAHLVKYRELPGPENFPSVYKWLKDQPGKVIMELPRGGEDVELQRMYYSWMHDKKMVNGYSGFVPTPVDVKADYVIIHKNDEEAVVIDNR